MSSSFNRKREVYSMGVILYVVFFGFETTIK
jgi:hypothetical protein